jgi:enoyl-CoA hydratase/carnithine racemase
MADYAKYTEAELLVTVDERVATIAINRPERMNATTTPIHLALEDLLPALNNDEDVRCVILTGTGTRAFSAGGDVKNMVRAADSNERKPLGGIIRNGKWIIQHFLNLEVPIIGALNGDAAGFGATLALMCDFTIMSEKARIGDTHVRMGLVAGDGGAMLWPYLIGMNRAKELLMTGRMVNAQDALRYGLVNMVVPQDQVMPKAMEMAKELAAGSPLAIKWTKQALNQHLWQAMIDTHHFSTAVESLTAITEDKKEAARSFAEKRKPNFRNQ